MSYFSNNICKLKSLLTFPVQSSLSHHFIYDFESHQSAKILAVLLANSELGTPELNRETVIKLLKGEILWPKESGRSETLSLSEDIELFEEVGAISFYADYLQAHFGTVRETDFIHESIKPFYSALSDLRDITCGVNGFIKPYFKIGKELAKNLSEQYIGKCDLNNLFGLSLSGNEYSIQLRGGESDRLLFGYLWEELNKGNSASVSFEKWLLVTNVYSEHFHQFIDGFSEELKKSFFEQVMILIEHDEQLKKPLYVLENQWVCASNFQSIFYQRNSTINIEMSVSLGKSTSNVTEGDVSIFTLDDVKDKYCNLEADISYNSLIELATDWGRKSNSREYGHGQFSFYFGFPNIIGLSDILIDSNAIYNYGKLDKLIDISEERPELKHILFNVLPNINNIDYLLYLLSKKNTSALGLFLIINNAPLVFLSNRFSEDITLNTVLNLACNEFLSVIFKNEYQVEINNVVELIVALAKQAINEGVNKEYSINKESLDILLGQLSIKQTECISEYLLEIIVQDENTREGTFPCWKLYLLFWLLEKSQVFGVLADVNFPDRVQENIINVYVFSFNKCLKLTTYPFEAIDFFDVLPWERLDSSVSIDVILALVEDPNSWIKNQVLDDKYNYYTRLRLVKSYLQILLLLNQTSGDSDGVLRKVLKIVRFIGFSCGDHSNGVFNDVVSDRYLLWELFCKWLDGLSDERFFDLVDDIDDSMPLDSLLELYRNTNKGTRRNKLLEMISGRRVENENLGLRSIESALISACGEGQIDLAIELLAKGLKYFEDGFCGEAKNNNIVNENKKWKTYQYKIEVLQIIVDDNCIEEKINLINNKQNPFQLNGGRYGVDADLRDDCDRFRRSQGAVTLFECDPDKSYDYFDALYRETKETQYSGKRFSAKLRSLEKNISGYEEYRYALSQWVDSIKTVNITQLENTDIQNWLHCMHELKLHEEIDILWLELAVEQRMNILIATNYCLSLKGRGYVYRAKTIYVDVKAYHKVESLGEVAEKEMMILDALILNDQEPMIVSVLSKQYSEKPKSIDELKRGYDETFSKRKLSEVVKIVSGEDESVESFLYSGIMDITCEIQLRKKNLQIHKHSDINSVDKTSCRITGEDLVNDWLTSLFERQYAYMGLSCRDQKRGGQSQSKKTPGEIDFFLCDKGNNRIAIMEAFRLFSNDTTVINTHLNKIAGYDQEGLGIVFVIGYCDVVNFSGLCEKYETDTQAREYFGFTKGRVSADKLVVRENSDTIKSYVEVRYRDEKPITIYHLMLNLHFTVQ
jgi:hypothetical protein